MPDLHPYIFSDDARKQAEFYVKALNGEILVLRTFAEMPQASEEIKDKVMHLRLKAAGQILYMCDSVNEPVQRGNGLHLILEFQTEEEARKAFEGLAQGGQVTLPLEKQFWGSMHGMLVDPFGVRWQIATEM
ncbi:MAG TPA: VOC family protein [Spirochaetia bacterium]|nr:VOC family protein [Spirochaetia bacterium]